MRINAGGIVRRDWRRRDASLTPRLGNGGSAFPPPTWRGAGNVFRRRPYFFRRTDEFGGFRRT